jgi:predicted ATP-grasp superfamily ATP-dependent carboligase
MGDVSTASTASTALNASMAKTALITLGRLPKALDIARALHASGWRVIVAEPYARHLTGASRAVSRSFRVTAPTLDPDQYLRDLHQIIDDESVELVVPVSEETMHVTALHEALHRRGVRLFTMPPDQVRTLYDKFGFIEYSESLGLSVPKTIALPGTAEFSGPVVVKPRLSCGGRGVRIFQSLADALDHSTGPGLIAQAWIAGSVHSTCSVIHEGRCLGTVVYRAAQLSGSVAVAFDRVEHPVIADWVRAFAKATRWRGFLSFDFVVDASGYPFAIECNPRATSGIHFFAQADLGAAMISPASVEQIRLRPERRLQQFWACLTEVQKKPFGRTLFQGLAQLFSTPDVSWSRSDPWPLLGMPYTAWPIIAAANRAGVSFGEVATSDLDWRGDVPNSHQLAA